MKIVFKTFIVSILFINVWSCNANSKSKSDITSHHEVKTETTEQFIKVALLLDTSNSMDGLIDQAKAQLWEIVNELSYAKCDNDRPSLKIALYEYGNDGLNAEKGYIRKVIDFSSDLDDISKELFSLTTNGGNEFCGHVIQTSLDQLKWGNNPDDLKLIFIAGNEPFTQGEVSYKTATTNANEKDVTVNTIFCGDYQEGIVSYWKEGANLTRGNYMAINHNQATANIPSPYDDDILILNQQLNKTYIYYGSNGSSKMALQEEQDSKAQGYSKANAVSRTVSKSSHLYKNSSWDLVDAVEIESLDLDKIKNDELPKELRDKSKEEIIAFLKTKKEERTSINKKIQELNKKRKAFISTSQSKNDNGLESAMIKAIKTQAKKKNYKWE
ncbi:vWA domain-containing protein [Pontimicrobium sp. IMCC45349]|uniref:vWA domain-containing protein n=1 Tax=Pontimicrobium sp. IMCC45349 TaxID=3391574 RepID=UPI0039A3F6FB